MTLLDTLRARLRRTPVLKLSLMPRRLRYALGYYEQPLKNLAGWLFRSNEVDNYTYELSAMNREHLAWFVAGVTGVPASRVSEYLRELDRDEALRAHIRDAVLGSEHRYVSDAVARYGRRVGWYAFVRALKPRVVVETGVDKGLGTCVLAAALLRNREEGSPGVVYGTDIRPEAGYLLAGPYAAVGKLLIGDSIASLKQLAAPIDLFINDSDHSAEYEYREYLAVADKLAEGAIVLGDNAHVSTSLPRFSHETGRSFLFFHETPQDHWYPGAGIGAAFFPKVIRR